MQIVATEGRQGMHTYYTAAMKVGELAQMVRLPDAAEFKVLDDDQRMQRALARTRLSALVRYLNENASHFFSAVTLIAIPREMDRPAKPYDPNGEEDDYDYWFERAEKKGPGRQRLGTLHLSGQIILFPADGQHRLAAEFEAMKENPLLAKEELPAVIVPFVSFDQVRQMFSDLNLNAKPVSKTVGYDFETRDPMAVLAKHLAQAVSLFMDGHEGSRVNRTSNSLPASSRNVITLNTLVQGTRNIIQGVVAAENIEGDQKRGAEEVYLTTNPAGATQQVGEIWETIIDAFGKFWQMVEDGSATPGELREKYLFPHGLGWLAVTRAAGLLIAKHGLEDWEAAFRRAVANLKWERDAKVWLNTAVIPNPDGTNRINNTAPAVTDAANTIVRASEPKSSI